MLLLAMRRLSSTIALEARPSNAAGRASAGTIAKGAASASNTAGRAGGCASATRTIAKEAQSQKKQVARIAGRRRAEGGLVLAQPRKKQVQTTRRWDGCWPPTPIYGQSRDCLMD
jgi:hypothetical protein